MGPDFHGLRELGELLLERRHVLCLRAYRRTLPHARASARHDKVPVWFRASARMRVEAATIPEKPQRYAVVGGALSTMSTKTIAVFRVSRRFAHGGMNWPGKDTWGDRSQYTFSFHSSCHTTLEVALAVGS